MNRKLVTSGGKILPSGIFAKNDEFNQLNFKRPSEKDIIKSSNLLDSDSDSNDSSSSDEDDLDIIFNKKAS